MTSFAPARSFRWLFWCLAVLGLAGDQVSKYVIFSHLYNDGAGGRIVLVPGAFDIAVGDFGAPFEEDEGVLHFLRTIGGIRRWPHVNRGALFGFGQGRNFFFGTVSIAAAIFIVGWSIRESASRDWVLGTALGLILAGTLGNLYDRVVFEGVRDFLHWHKWIDWDVFNIADVCLVSGAGLLLLEAFFRKPAEELAVSAASS